MAFKFLEQFQNYRKMVTVVQRGPLSLVLGPFCKFSPDSLLIVHISSAQRLAVFTSADEAAHTPSSFCHITQLHISTYLCWDYIICVFVYPLSLLTRM